MGAIDKLTKAFDGMKTGLKEGFESKRGSKSSENPATPGFWEKTASEVLAGVLSGLVKRYGKREEALEKFGPEAKKAMPTWLKALKLNRRLKNLLDPPG